MTGYVTTGAGERFLLPAPIQWQFNYTAGVPCDSFLYRCPWDSGGDETPARWTGFYAEEGGEVVFRGVVDECETSISESGALLEVTGRGMAALLLDNEALGQDYAAATLEDILNDHVRCYGIEVAEKTAIPAVNHFSVVSGSSEWSVLYDFCQYHGGVAPRFDRRGRLVLTGWPDSGTILIGDKTPVTELICRDRRYGVLSEIWVRDRVRQVVEKLEQRDIKGSGGQARRVLTMPGRSDYQAMRYSGEFQLKKSRQELLRLEAEVAVPFFGKPGDLVQLSRTSWGRNGTYRVVEAQTGQGAKGGWTRLELGETDVLI